MIRRFNKARFRYHPNAYRIDRSTGYVAGTVTMGEGDSAPHVLNFLLALEREPDGRWKIAAEALSESRQPVALSPERLVAELDDAGVQRALVLSTAFWYGAPSLVPVENEYAKVQAENDWTASLVTRFPDRLVAFCSFNPLKEYALVELDRCATHPTLTGLKLHFGNSQVDVRDPHHLERLRAVFRAANERRLPIVVDVYRGSAEEGYGRQHSEIFLSELLPLVPDVPVQIAHLTDTGPGFSSDAALSVFAEAAARGDPRMRNVYFDVASNVVANASRETLELIARRLRQLGVQRILFGTDRHSSYTVDARQAWRDFQQLPLSEEEFRTIANNVAPYMRRGVRIGGYGSFSVRMFSTAEGF